MKQESDGSSTAPLDILTNMTAVVMILFMVLAGINSLTRIRVPVPVREGSPGPGATLLDLEPMRPVATREVVVAQVTVSGAGPETRLRVGRTRDLEGSCEVFEAVGNDREQWLITKVGEGGRCEVVIENTPAGSGHLQAAALVTRGDFVLPLLGPKVLVRRSPEGQPVVLSICDTSRDGTGVILGGTCGGA